MLSLLARRIKNAWIICNVHRLATILHPRLKNFESCADEKQTAIAALQSEFEKRRSIHSPISTNLSRSNEVCSSVSSKKFTSTKSSTTRNLLAQCFDAPINAVSKSPNPNQEIKDYLDSEHGGNRGGCHDGDGDIDVLLFWKEKQHLYPVLASLARSIYAIPASNTSIEHLFQASKNLVGEKRINLGSEKINQLLFLQKNLHVLKQLESELCRCHLQIQYHPKIRRFQ